MKRTAGACVLVAVLTSGCVSTDGGQGWGGSYGQVSGPRAIPGVEGAWGQPVAMAFPYSSSPPSGEAAAQDMLARSLPLDLVQASAAAMGNMPSGLMQAGGPGVPPPPGALSAPGMPYQPAVPGMAGAGGYPPGAVAAVGANVTPQASRFPTRRTEVSFTSPYGMKVSWYAPSADGRGGFTTNHIDAPGRYNFVQGAVYRLKLSDIPNRAGVELYPTLEVVPSNLKTDAFLAHSAVPVSFTNEDLDQVAAGNYLVKVIYLPDPQFQDLAVAGPEEIVSSRLEPGVDPVAEAQRRGSILLVVRVGNIDLELANSPAMDAPGQYGPRAPAPATPGNGMMPGMHMHGGMGMPGPGMRGMMMPGMGGMPMMAPNAPMMNGGGMPMMPAGVLPNVPAAPEPATSGPTSRSSDSPGVQQTGYNSAGNAFTTSAQLATQMPDMTSQDKSKRSTKGGW